MDTQIRIYQRPGGQIQRVQLVRPDSWEQLEFLQLQYGKGALECYGKIYEQYLVPACPWLFGNMVLFRLPPGMQPDFALQGRYGELRDPLTAAAAALRQGVRFSKGKPVFRTEAVKEFWKELERQGCIQVVRGRLPITTAIPVGNLPGYLSKTETQARLRVNGPFFIMDRFDCATVYDHVGTPLGLRVRRGVIENPPLYDREALLVRQSGVTVAHTDIRQLHIQIAGEVYRHRENAVIYTRPERARAPRGGRQLVIVGCRVAAVLPKGGAEIPASGFVLAVEKACRAKPGDPVTYRGMEDVLFGIQVGNSIVKNGVPTTKFFSRFYNIRRLQPVAYPPSLYPMDFSKARAARIALGADSQGKPMLLWAEGAAKQGQIPGEDSVGASLQEMAEICRDVGMVNAVNLDGGGSAQLLLDGKRSLRISDRNPDGTEAERPIPLALVIRG